MKSRFVKGILIVSGAVVLSTLGIYASDSLQGIEGGLQNLAGIKNAQICKEGSLPHKIDSNVICVDMYEASPAPGCPHQEPSNTIQSEQNINSGDCFPVTEQGVIPWRYMSLPQAQRMCASVGKRLPTSAEWYDIALGTNPTLCTIDENTVARTGNEECISSVGAYDVIGNVWEWVDESVVNNNLNDRALPPEGYVTSVDADGVAITSSDSADDLYGKDYFWSKGEGVHGMIRGGFYGSRDDAGLYTINASVPTSFATQGVGFRCVEDVL